MGEWDITGLLVGGAVFSFAMCFGMLLLLLINIFMLLLAMGCNDESMGSAYGSRAYSLRTAVIVGEYHSH